MAILPNKVAKGLAKREEKATTEFRYAIDAQGQATVHAFEQQVSMITIKNQQLQGAIWETLSQSLSFSDPGAVAIKPLHQHAQELVKSCKDLLEKYNDIDEHLEIARSRAPSDNDWQREAESVERILKQQAGRAKQEITVHLHGVARVVEKTNDSEVNFKDDDIWSRFARVTPDAVDSTRANVAGNWATVAKRAEKDISRLVKHFSDEED